MPNEGKPDLYLLCASLEKSIVVGAFLATSDRLDVVENGIREVDLLYKDYGVSIIGQDSFMVWHSDNQSGLHKRLEDKFKVIATSCVYHTESAWDKKLNKYSTNSEQEEIFKDFKEILRKCLFENAAFLSSVHSFLAKLTSENREHPWIAYIKDNYSGDGLLLKPRFSSRFWACQDIMDPKYSNLPNFANPNRTNNTCESNILIIFCPLISKTKYTYTYVYS